MSARTEDRRIWLGGGAILAVAILVLGWFVVVNPQLTTASSTRDEIESVRTQNLVLEAKNAKLKAQNDDVASLRDTLAAAVAQLPFDSGLPEFTRQVSAQATENSVALASIVVGAAAAVAGTTTSDTATATPTSTGLVGIPVTLVATGTNAGQLAFLTALQVTGPRRALISSAQLAPVGGNEAAGADAQLTMTIQLTVFSAPLSPTAQEALQKLLSGN